MPIPSPHSGEDQQKFVSRCMGDSAMVAEYTDQKQRAAICYSQWRRKVAKADEPPITRDAFLYLDPSGRNIDEFAQCSTCSLLAPNNLCAIIGVDVSPTNAVSCSLYIPGEPDPHLTVHQLVTAKEAGLVNRQVRCENCGFFDQPNTCWLYTELNRKFPDLYNLDTNVHPKGCCNAQEPSVAKASISTMKLYGAIEKVEPLQDGTVRVHGIASTESTDDQGEIVRAEAMRTALPNYMRFPAIREMHQLQAAGTALEADVGDDGITRIVAHVIDPIAVSKVRNQVYRGFSIGGRVTKRDEKNPKVITGLILNEVSLVDRPANPEATFDCWKAGGIGDAAGGLGTLADTPAGAKLAELIAQAKADVAQVWNCGNPEHRHALKAEALKCAEDRAAIGVADAQAELEAAERALDAPILPDPAATAALQLMAQKKPIDLLAGRPIDEHIQAGWDYVNNQSKAAEKKGDSSKPYGDVPYADPGYQSDGKKRYPLDTEAHIRAAWSYINMPKNSSKYSSEQLSSIKSKIRSAMKRIGADVSGKVAVDKALWNIGTLASLIWQIHEYCESLEEEAQVEGDESPQPAKLKAIVSDLCEFLNDQVAEDTAEILTDSEAEPEEMEAPMMGPAGAMPFMFMASATDSLRKFLKDPLQKELIVSKLEEAMEKAGRKHSASDQAYLDTVSYALRKALDTAVAKKAELDQIDNARKAVLEAGAADIGADGRDMLSGSDGPKDPGNTTQNSTVDTGRNAATTAPNPTGASPSVADAQGHVGKTAKSFAIIDALVKANKGHMPLLNISHDLLHAVSEGAVCDLGKANSRHSAPTLASMRKAHDHLTGAGAKCANNPNQIPGGEPTGEPEEEDQGTVSSAKVAVANPNNDPLEKKVDERFAEVNKTLAAIADQVKKIAQTPMPPSLAARIPVGDRSTITKHSDIGNSDDPLVAANMGQDFLAEAFANMSEEEQAITMIKAARKKPFRPASLSTSMEQREFLKNQK